MKYAIVLKAADAFKQYLLDAGFTCRLNMDGDDLNQRIYIGNYPNISEQVFILINVSGTVASNSIGYSGTLSVQVCTKLMSNTKPNIELVIRIVDALHQAFPDTVQYSYNGLDCRFSESEDIIAADEYDYTLNQYINNIFINFLIQKL